ncbi:2-C-methyl-D-erythritol 4-phosphate cytidylyltransferase [Aureibacillus halotolerans]|uniref:2-C-methyl-D-erythritol 4-phosphate cytidylyltransferase n=1 Tax=Aureibacillus halotolerans TaxID=1508390 RepID=A0A4R6TRN8_9BACI|nr:2-C-methyl-D-erythritol 4-phosphate cytidylyltransferase [Aureibacillus halotolerans]TDQ34685.1 2-C-methyl-D-erythritol 4-phosphate cytidylyltransferase [Aureibacillus halotolerans]
MKYTVVIPAAGYGKRMKTKQSKQFLLLRRKPLIVWTLECFMADPNCEELIVVINRDHEQDMKQLLAQYELQSRVRLVHGGKERQHSVALGLKAVHSEATMVLVHDGARPFVTHAMISELTAKASKVGGAVPAVPLKDTVKRVTGDVIQETLDRSQLWAIQTPQAFLKPVIEEAHRYAEEAGFLGTDEASLVEKIGKSVSIVAGSYRNIKITTPEDLVLAEAFIEGEEQ